MVCVLRKPITHSNPFCKEYDVPKVIHHDLEFIYGTDFLFPE